MDVVGLLIPMLSNSPQVKAKVESIFGQPVDHVSKCVSQFLDGIKGGPGLVDQQLIKQKRFMHIYQSGLRMGFKDYEAQLAAADCAGYPIIDVANSFAQNRGWNCTIEQLEQLHREVMPRFMDMGRKTGLFKGDPPEQKLKGIPSVQVATASKEPPWRTRQQVKGAPVAEDK